MAEGRIKGITIEIDGDVTGLNKALESTTKELRSTQKQLNDVNRLLKLDPTNTELLSQKQRLLGDAIKSTQDKLETLKKAEEQAAAKLESGGKEAQEQYEALRREIISTESDLGKLEKQAANAERALDDAGDNGAESIKDAGSAAKDAESKVAGFGSAAKAAGVAAAAAFAAAAAAAISAAKALVDMTVGGAEYADEVLTLSIQTGIATDKLQEYMYAAELVDVSTETLTKSMAKNIKSMKSASDGSAAYAEAYEQLGVSVVDANGALRDGEVVYWEAIDALGKIENETERDAIAMQLFGKSAQELNPLVEAGASRMQELGKSAQEAGYVINDDMLNAYGALDDQLRYLDGGATAAKNALGTILLSVLTDLAGEGVDLLGEFTQGVLNADGDISKLSDVIGDVLPKAIDAIMSYFPEFLEIGGEIVFSIAGGIVDNIPQIVKAGEKLIGRLASGVFKSIPDLIKMLGSIISEMKETTFIVGGLIIALKGFKIVDSLSKSVKGFTGIFSGLNAAMNANPIGAIVSAVGALIAVFGLLASATEDVCKPVYNLSEAEEEVIEKAKDAKESYEELKRTFSSDVDAIMEETKRVEDLWGELQTLADENGNVEEANRDRAGYILGELKEATGEEWEMIDGTIQRYDELKGSIEETIKAKKAEKLVEAGEQSYDTAKANYGDSLEALEIQDKQIKAQQQQLAADRQALAAFEAEYAQELSGVDYNLADMYAIYPALALEWENLTNKVSDTEGVLTNLEEEYEEANKTAAKYYEDMYYYEQAQEAVLSGNYDEAIELMTRDTVYRWNKLAENRKISREELSDLKRDYDSALFVAENYRKNYEAGMVGYTEEGLKEAEAAAAELKRIWREAAEDAHDFGGNITEGLARGIRDKSTDVDEAAGYVAFSALSKIKNVAQIASPSKVTTRYGVYLDAGLADGLGDGMGEVLRVAENIADSVLSRLAFDPAAYGDFGASAMLSAPTSPNYSTVYNNSTSLGGVSVYVSAPNVDNVEDLADLVADRINTDIINRQAVYR